MMEAHFDSPLGRIRLQADAQGLAGIWFAGQAYEPAPAVAGSNAHTEAASAWLEAYFRRLRLPAAPIRSVRGTAFQQQVWAALTAIPLAQTQGYGVLAAALGRAGAARALGAAVGRNPWSVLVPCHRVLGQGGRLTGYAGGLGRKQALLAWEQGQDWPWQRLRQAYRCQYPVPLQVRPGDVVQGLPHPDSGEFPGWVYARDAAGHQAWVPGAWFASASGAAPFGPAGGTATALRSYSSMELDAEAGDAVLELDAVGGWSLVRHADGRIGWLLQALLPGARQAARA